MILDSLGQSATYRSLSPHFPAAFAFLRAMTDSVATGRHDLAGDDAYALVQRYTTKPLAERQYEAHRRYLDIQYVFRGREMMYWAPLPKLTTVTMPYDEKGDASLFALIPDGLALPVEQGQFTVFFPSDGHVPACAWNEPSEVVKVVVKVRV